MLPSDQNNEKSTIDIPFFLFAILFCMWGLSEYLYPPSQDFFERTIPKFVHALILLWSMLCLFYDYRVHGELIQFKRTILWGGILAGTLFLLPFFSYNNVEDKLIPFLRIELYSGFYITQWYVLMLFCAVHMQVNPKAYHTFLYFVPAMTLFFYIATIEHTNLNIETKGDERYQTGIYAGYYLVCLYPFIWDLRSRILKYGLLLLVVYGVIYSMKRGAMLCLLSSLFCSFLFYYLFFATGLKRIPYFYAMVILFFIMSMAMVYSVNKKQETFNQRMENIESGSGRVEIYEDAYHHFWDASISKKIFGATDLKFCAHNDFLFLLINYGLVGFLSLVLFNIAGFFLILEVLQARFTILPSFIVACVNLFIIEMISYGVEGHAYTICCVYVGIVQGYVLSKENETEKLDVIEEIIYDDWIPDDSIDLVSEESAILEEFPPKNISSHLS